MREQLLLHPSKYIPNEFADKFSKNVRFLWSDPLESLATVDVATGMYEMSNSLKSRFSDISCWTLCFDFFAEYPELIGLVPIYNPIPTSLPLGASTDSNAAATDNGLGVCDWPADDSIFLDTGWMS
jgi:hypothetical protein